MEQAQAKCGCGFLVTGPPEYVNAMYGTHKCSKEGGFWSNFGEGLAILAFLLGVAAIILACTGKLPW